MSALVPVYRPRRGAASGDTLQGLHARAKSEQWDPEHVLDWRALEFDRLSGAVCSAMSSVYTAIREGEEQALSLAARLVGVCSDPYVRQLAAIHVMDEARHVEFFSRLLDAIDQQPASNTTRALRPVPGEGLASQAQLLTQLLLADVLAWSLYTELAQKGRQAHRREFALDVPGTQVGLSFVLENYVLRDESRHIAFARSILEHASLEPRERRVLGDLWSDSCLWVYERIDSVRIPLRTLDVEADSVLHRFVELEEELGRALGLLRA